MIFLSVILSCVLSVFILFGFLDLSSLWHHSKEHRRSAGADDVARFGGEARSVVQIVQNGVQVCSGAIIDPYTVITAKHCFEEKGQLIKVEDPSKDPFTVAYGTVQMYNPEKDSQFDKVKIASYHHHELHDVSVLSLTAPIQLFLAERIQLDTKCELKCGMVLKLYGFGYVDELNSDPEVMQVLHTKVKNDCESVGQVGEDIVTQVEGKTSCEVRSVVFDDKLYLNHNPKGDSGGPLVTLHGEMIGIHTSSQHDPCKLGDFNYAVKLCNVIDFVKRFCKTCS